MFDILKLLYLPGSILARNRHANHYSSTATATTCPQGRPSTRKKTEAFKKQKTHRARIEGTISLGVSTFDFLRARHLGLAKDHLHYILVAVRLISPV